MKLWYTAKKLPHNKSFKAKSPDGLLLNIFDISNEKWVFYTAGAMVLLVTLGPVLYQKLRQKLQLHV